MRNLEDGEFIRSDGDHDRILYIMTVGDANHPSAIRPGDKDFVAAVNALNKIADIYRETTVADIEAQFVKLNTILSHIARGDNEH